MVLHLVKSKREILGSAKKLTDSETWSNIFITPDMITERQRKEQTTAWRTRGEELKRRLNEGEEELVIRGGQIKQLNQPRDNHDEGALVPKWIGALASKNFCR